MAKIRDLADLPKLLYRPGSRARCRFSGIEGTVISLAGPQVTILFDCAVKEEVVLAPFLLPAGSN
jgi:hypothetical protein